MSYLDALRLHFSGRFQAAPSTVNNILSNYDLATFNDSAHNPGPKGLWNPKGDANWRLVDCRVTAAHSPGGVVAISAAQDPVAGLFVADSDRMPPAKLVDLDPDQQLVPTIWGLEVRLCDADGRTCLRGQFEPAAFHDIWSRTLPPQGGGGGSGDSAAAAMWQSILHSLEWGDVNASPFLNRLRSRAADGLLSIKFNVDSYNLDDASPDFTYGRVVGTIGPAQDSEPRHFTRGRHFLSRMNFGGGFPTPVAGVQFCTAVVDRAEGKVLLDLGNALFTQAGAARFPDIADISLLELTVESSGGGPPVVLDEIPYRQPGWYEQTAGVVALPAQRRLGDAELARIAANRLLIRGRNAAGQAVTRVAESPGGVYIRADQIVQRLNPGDTAEVALFATRFGEPHAGATIQVRRYLDLLSSDSGTPETAITFPQQLTTDADGRATLRIGASSPGKPRNIIDGQMYGVRPILAETAGEIDAGTYPISPFDFISLLVWDDFQPSEPVAWEPDLRPILQQYRNLYPVMLRFLELNKIEQIEANRDKLQFVFGLDPAHPNYMPVTRDLSRAKVRAILRWLDNPGPEGRLLRGREAPPPIAAPVVAAAPAADAGAEIPIRDGKTRAMRRQCRIAPSSAALEDL